jgi:hypothetical protein
MNSVGRIRKINYTKVQADTSWIGWFLWDSLAPGWTAIFLTLTGLWYYYKSFKSVEYLEGVAYNDAAVAFFLWGFFNLIIYRLLILYQSGTSI